MNRLVLLLAFLTLTFTSCTTAPYRPYAREAKKKPGIEGMIALKADYVPEDRALADTLMAKNCGNEKVNVIEEGEVVVGTTTSSKTDSRESQNVSPITFGNKNIFSAYGSNSGSSETTSKTIAEKEWQIQYNCTKVIANNEEVKSSPLKKNKKAKSEVAKNKEEERATKQ